MLLILMAASALAADDWRFNAGAEVSAEPHGVMDVGWRRGPWSVQWMTDTLDVRWDQGRDHGRSWAAVRAEAWMAGLMMWPWAGGAPTPGRALTASYLGVEEGHQWHKEQGWYLGVSGWARQVSYGALPTTTIQVPRAGPIGQLEASLGQWTEEARAELSLGASVQPWGPSTVAPHARLVLEVHPAGTLRPVVAVHMGWAHGQADINKTRLGGLNPYVVPLAGAGRGGVVGGALRRPARRGAAAHGPRLALPGDRRGRLR